jgi:hypothetical protein
MEEKFKSTNNLDFEVAPWVTSDFIRFRVGTCEGLWRSTNVSYDILAIHNSSPGNGHVQDVFDWFERSCKKEGKKLMVLEIWNNNFKRHLIERRGFTEIGPDNVEKMFN